MIESTSKEEIDENQFYNSTRMFCINPKGLFQANIGAVIKCWDIWTAIIISLLILIFVSYNPHNFQIHNVLSNLLELSVPVVTAIAVISATGITLFITFQKDDSYIMSLSNSNVYSNSLFLPYWIVFISLLGLTISIISNIFNQICILNNFIFIIIIFGFNLFFLLYSIFLFGNFSGTLVRHGIYRMRNYREQETENNINNLNHCHCCCVVCKSIRRHNK